MKYPGLVTAGLVLSLAAVETTPRKETFDNPHLPHADEVSIGVVTISGIAASGTAIVDFSPLTRMNELLVKGRLTFPLRKSPHQK